MRSGFSGLALASVLLLSSALTACGKSEPAAPAAPAGLALSTEEGAHGVLPAQGIEIKTKGSDVQLSMTPNWRVGGRQLNIMWYAGASQTKRFFVVTEKGVAADQPKYLANPETGVRNVRVSLDGCPPVTLETPPGPGALRRAGRRQGGHPGGDRLRVFRGAPDGGLEIVSIPPCT